VNVFQDSFSITQVSRWLKISWRRLDYWDRRGIVKPSVVQASGPGRGKERRYSFADLVTLRAVARLREHHIPAIRLRKALKHLQERTRDAADLLRRGMLITDGHDLYEVTEQESRLVELSQGGQFAFSFALRPLADDVSRRIPLRYRPNEQPPVRAKKTGGV
jgi:DNA-binding transcriptional MerR regulator